MKKGIHSEKGNSVVSDGNLPGNFQMGEGLGYGVWDENGDWWDTSKTRISIFEN